MYIAKGIQSAINGQFMLFLNRFFALFYHFDEEG